VCVTIEAREGKTEGKEERGMNHMDFDPNLIKERNQQIRREVDSLRFEERLRKERNPRGSQLSVLVERGNSLSVERGSRVS
jgi:hypothetical protein